MFGKRGRTTKQWVRFMGKVMKMGDEENLELINYYFVFCRLLGYKYITLL